MNNQLSHIKYLGFTLVEVMVVILIITLLLWLGNFWGLFSRRENARIEELAVNIVGLMDEEKTNALLGKTEWGEIVRKRKVFLILNILGEITYQSSADLAKDPEDSFLSGPITKKWTLTGMTKNLWQCDGITPDDLGPPVTLEVVMTGDSIVTTTSPVSTKPHLILQITRNGVSREIHIDKRTGLTYERVGTATPSCT